MTFGAVIELSIGGCWHQEERSPPSQNPLAMVRFELDTDVLHQANKSMVFMVVRKHCWYHSNGLACNAGLIDCSS